MSRLEFRVITPCPELHPADSVPCEREAGHPSPHWYSVWETCPETFERWPSYPRTWETASEVAS